jgi:hypothetical protein
MRFRRIVAALTVLPFALAGCGKPEPATEAEATQAAGEPWVVVEPGRPTPSPARKLSGSLKPALPPVSFMPTTDTCTIAWPEQEAVLIPMVVTPGAGSFTVQWPNRYGDTYRLAAVPQEIVTGEQPEPAWQTVKTGAECEVTATVSGLTSGAAYIIWLDAPNTPRRLDGSRSLYSGKTKVVIPN